MRRLAAQLLHQGALRPGQLVDGLDHVHRHPDRPGLVGQRPGHRLADPPRGVRRELEALAVVELLDRPDQPEVALLDQVEQRQAAAHVLLGDRDDQPQVGLDQALAGPVGRAAGPLQDRCARRRRVTGLGELRACSSARIPDSICIASSTSCCGVSSGKRPISWRYIRTGSETWTSSSLLSAVAASASWESSRMVISTLAQRDEDVVERLRRSLDVFEFLLDLGHHEEPALFAARGQVLEHPDAVSFTLDSAIRVVGVSNAINSRNVSE